MAFKNFIPTFWSTAIQRDLERLCVFAEDCNRQYEGEVKKLGDGVRLLGVGKPTIKDLTSADLDSPEEIADTSVTLNIQKSKYFNYAVDDIDKAQAVGGIMEALSNETSEGLANAIDSYIAGFALDSNVKKLHATAPTVVAGTPGTGEVNVRAVLNGALKELYKNDVNQNTKIVATVSPDFYMLLKEAYENLDTDNSDMLKNGRVGRYGNIIIKMSNNVAKSQTSAANDTDNIMIRTQRAIAFVNPLTETEALRSTVRFADVVRGYTLYDAKIVRPKEIININVKY